ncbi:M23 family metallopeptidase [Cardiobacterium valvarum]|uniref:M23 family metallopeptidase n=1 Tax=Cardiobacterium valvarum TaxID=194702 RepID=UPI0035ECFDC3
MPQHPHNDRILQRLLPWLALIGFLGVALYALLPLDFWLPEYKSAHHTVTSGEALPDDIPPDEADGDIVDDDQPSGEEKPETLPGETKPETQPSEAKPETLPSGEKPETPSSKTKPETPPSGTKPETPSSETKPEIRPAGQNPKPHPAGQNPKPAQRDKTETRPAGKPESPSGEEKIVESKGSFRKHYRSFRAVGNQWQHIAKSDLNPVLIKQLEPLQHKIGDEAISTVEILYSTYTKDGKTNPENSKIIAARLREGRYTYTYYARFEGKNIWYYDREGNAPEVAMDRVPLDHYDHISSPFDPARVHPITRIIRPHEGTDFKAAHGSPVRATGDGIVNYAGWRGGYGRVVIIDHANGYQTRYAHLSDLDVETGQEIARGQTVGRLGNSGMSTGSHLHYEVRINDIPYDPMTVQLPENKPLAENYKDAWRYRCTQYEREMTEIAKQGVKKK